MTSHRSVMLMLALLLSAGFAACGDDSGGDGEALLKEAASKRIESAVVDVRVKATLDGLAVLGESTVVEARGPVRWSGTGTLPEADLEVLVRGGGSSFPARAYSDGRRLFVEFQGRDYEAGDELASLLPGADGGAISLERLLGVSPARWLSDPTVEEGDEIGGDATRAINGELDPETAAHDLSPRGLDHLAEAIEPADVTVNVDDEGYPRRLSAELRFQSPEGYRPAGIRGGTVEVEAVVERLGASVDVRAPRDPERLSSLLRSVGAIFGIEALAEGG